MLTEPVDDVQAAHAVVAVTDNWVVGVEFLETGRDGAHGDEDGTFDAALGVFPGFADVDEEEFFAVVEALLEFSC